MDLLTTQHLAGWDRARWEIRSSQKSYPAHQLKAVMRPVESQRGKEMCLPTSPKTVKTQLALLGSLVLLWLLYTVLYTFHPSDDLAVFLEFIPGGLAIGILVATGLSPKDWYLRVGRISRRGLVLLAALFAFMPFILLTGRVSFRHFFSVIYGHF